MKCDTMKKILLAAVLLTAALTCGCAFGKKELEQTDEPWEAAYKDIILNVEKNLSDPWEFRTEILPFNSIYLVLHDFNEDQIPEMVIGDSGTAAVYTYENGYAKRITDLCQSEDWGGINGLYLKDNTVTIITSGSDGSGYLCFTYDYINDRGRYVTGSFDEYNPEVAIINGSVWDAEFFEKQFPDKYDDLGKNYLIEMIKKEGDMIFPEEDGKGVPIKDFDLALVMR